MLLAVLCSPDEPHLQEVRAAREPSGKRIKSTAPESSEHAALEHGIQPISLCAVTPPVVSGWRRTPPKAPVPQRSAWQSLAPNPAPFPDPEHLLPEHAVSTQPLQHPDGAVPQPGLPLLCTASRVPSPELQTASALLLTVTNSLRLHSV